MLGSQSIQYPEKYFYILDVQVLISTPILRIVLAPQKYLYVRWMLKVPGDAFLRT
jgi:hypothetical protein